MSSDTGNLKLSNFEKRLLKSSEINCDCEFIVGSEKIVIKGHKHFFSTASEVFQAMFFGELKEENAVIIPDLNPEGFQGMKFFIYTGKVNFTSVLNAIETLTAARKYLISELTNECIEYITKKLLPSEVLEFYEYSKVHQIPELEEVCCDIIQKRTRQVVESDYFNIAKMETIETLLKIPSLNLSSEIDLINYLKKWVKAEVDREGISLEDMTTYFNSLKIHIRFLTLSSEDFVSTCSDFCILTEKEKLAIAFNLMKPGSHPMPETLSSEHKCRDFTNFIELGQSCYDLQATISRRPRRKYNTCKITELIYTYQHNSLLNS